MGETEPNYHDGTYRTEVGADATGTIYGHIVDAPESPQDAQQPTQAQKPTTAPPAPEDAARDALEALFNHWVGRGVALLGADEGYRRLKMRAGFDAGYAAAQGAYVSEAWPAELAHRREIRAHDRGYQTGRRIAAQGAGEVAVLEARHAKVAPEGSSLTVCSECGILIDWPCDAARAIATIRALEAERDSLRAVARAASDVADISPCNLVGASRYCVAHTEDDPCAMQDLRDALAALDGDGGAG